MVRALLTKLRYASRAGWPSRSRLLPDSFRPLLWVASVLFLTVSLSAQTVMETFEVHVLEVEAVVLDQIGKPVHGLTRADFEVKVDGQPAEVTNFFAVNRGEIVEAPATADAGAAPVQRIPARLIIVLDDLHLRPGGRKRALEALKKYVQTSMDESTTAMIVRWDGSLKTRVRPTSDRQALLRSIARIERESPLMIRSDSDRRLVIRQIDDVILHPIPFLQDAQASAALANAVRYVEEQTRGVRNTIGALSELITVVSGLDGRKTVLYVSEAMAQQPGAEVLEYARDLFTKKPVPGFNLEHELGGNAIDVFRYDQSKTFLELSSLAQSAGVIFSSLDPGGLRGDEGTGPEYVGNLATVDAMFIRQNDSSGARAVAAATGGRYIENENNLEHAIAVLTGDVSTYYSLGVRPPNRRTVNVSVSVRGRNDLRVLTPRRREVRSAEEAMASAIRARLYSREEVNPLAARLLTGAAWPRGERCVVPVQVTVPVASLTALPENAMAIHAMVVDDRSMESSVLSSVHPVTPGTTGPVVITLDFGLKPRRYVLSLAVVDKASNETSYLQADVDASICGDLR